MVAVPSATPVTTSLLPSPVTVATPVLLEVASRVMPSGTVTVLRVRVLLSAALAVVRTMEASVSFRA